jgi:hypothetical protein
MKNELGWRLIKNDLIKVIKESDNSISFSELARWFGVSRQSVHNTYRSDHNSVDYPAREKKVYKCKLCGTGFVYNKERKVRSYTYCDVCLMLRVGMWSKKKMLYACCCCGKSSRPHNGNGLCDLCYHRNRYASIEEVREKHMKLVKKYYLRNKDKARVNSKKYYLRNKDKFREYSRKYSLKKRLNCLNHNA